MSDYVERRIAGPLAGDFDDIEAVFINGPRQSGKSAFTEAFGSRYERVFYAGFDDISLRAAEMASPGQIFLLNDRMAAFWRLKLKQRLRRLRGILNISGFCGTPCLRTLFGA